MGTDVAFARRAFLGGALATLGLRASLANAASSLNERMQGEIEPVHDPCIIKQGDTYYVFSTNTKSDTEGFIPCRRSRDLVSWELASYVFAQIPEWAHDAVPSAKGLWAPDISFFNDEYHLYYSASSFGSSNSVIGLATNKTLDPSAPGFGWVDKGLVMRSRSHDKYNAIDPNLVADRDGKYWLAWGSFWSGLKMFRVDPATGKRVEGEELYSIASRAPSGRGAPNAIEAPFIVSHGDFYYLFASYDFCCRGAKSDYFVACGRSREITGPYVDVNGKSLMEGGGSVVIQGNERFKGTGHNAVLHDGDRDYLVYHAYDAEQKGTPTLRISPIYWTADGWPRAQL